MVYPGWGWGVFDVFGCGGLCRVAGVLRSKCAERSDDATGDLPKHAP